MADRAGGGASWSPSHHRTVSLSREAGQPRGLDKSCCFFCAQVWHSGLSPVGTRSGEGPQGHGRGGEEAPHTPRVPWDTGMSLVHRCDGGTHRPEGHG